MTVPERSDPPRAVAVDVTAPVGVLEPGAFCARDDDGLSSLDPLVHRRVRVPDVPLVEAYDRVAVHQVAPVFADFNSGTGGRRAVPGVHGRGGGRLAGRAHREKHGHGRPFAGAALDHEVPPVGVDDPVHDREPEPRPARARGEERVARARADLRVHALAGVDDVHREPVLPLVLHRPNADRERSAVVHRLHGVVDQVVEDLAQEVRVSPDARLGDLVVQLDAHRLVPLRELEPALEEIGERGCSAAARSPGARSAGDP